MGWKFVSKMSPKGGSAHRCVVFSQTCLHETHFQWVVTLLVIAEALLATAEGLLATARRLLGNTQRLLVIARELLAIAERLPGTAGRLPGTARSLPGMADCLPAAAGRLRGFAEASRGSAGRLPGMVERLLLGSAWRMKSAATVREGRRMRFRRVRSLRVDGPCPASIPPLLRRGGSRCFSRRSRRPCRRFSR